VNGERNGGDRVGVRTKLAYGVGALTEAIRTFSFSLFLLFYYTSVLGLAGTLVGLAMSVGLLWDAAVDPLIGHWSDRATMHFRRRHGFMLAGALGSGAAFIAVFNPPAGLSTGGLFAWLMVWSLCLRSSTSLFMVPYYALGAELSSDYHERTSVSAYRAGAVVAGTLLATVIAFSVFLPNMTPNADAKFATESYSSMGLAFGLAIVVVGLVAIVGTLRARPKPVSATIAGGRSALIRTVVGALSNRSLRVLVLSSSLSFMGAAINAALAMHFLTYHARIPTTQSFTLYFVAFYGGALAGVIVWAQVTRRFAKHRAYAATTFVTAVVVSGGYWLVGEGRLFGTGSLPILVIGNAVAGFFAMGGPVIVPSMIADVAARDELHNGRRRDGVFFGIYSFGQQVSGGVAVLVAGVLVDRFAGLVPAQTEQSAATAERLALISNLLPALILAAAGIVALRYRLTREDVQGHEPGLAAPSARPNVPA
jgi:Na+/melibiose symporter-like transporter